MQPKNYVRVYMVNDRPVTFTEGTLYWQDVPEALAEAFPGKSISSTVVPMYPVVVNRDAGTLVNLNAPEDDIESIRVKLNGKV